MFSSHHHSYPVLARPVYSEGHLGCTHVGRVRASQLYSRWYLCRPLHHLYQQFVLHRDRVGAAITLVELKHETNNYKHFNQQFVPQRDGVRTAITLAKLKHETIHYKHINQQFVCHRDGVRSAITLVNLKHETNNYKHSNLKSFARHG